MRDKLFLPILLLAATSFGLAFSALTYALVHPRSVLAATRHDGHGTLTGKVTGPDDKPVSHAAITYQSSAGMKVHIIHTDSQGRFTISKLKTDNYEVRADSHGLFSEWVHNVQVIGGRQTTLDLRLEYTKSPLQSQPSTRKKPAARPASSKTKTASN